MATKSENQSALLRVANRELRLAVEECQALLARTEDLLRRSGQDNDPPRRD